MSDDKNVRHRFTVPVADVKVNQWIESQSNLGFSLRVLIKAFVRNYGYQDATCLEFGTEVKKRGRPSKQMKIQLGQMLDDEDEDIQDDDSFEPSEQEMPVSVPPITPITKSRADASVKVQVEGPAKQAAPAKPVITAKPAVTPATTPAPEDTDKEDDLMSMFNSPNSSEQTNGSQSDAVASDDDGFIDPEDLLK